MSIIIEEFFETHGKIQIKQEKLGRSGKTLI